MENVRTRTLTVELHLERERFLEPASCRLSVKM